MNEYGRVFVIHKSHNNYKCKIIESSQLASGTENCNLTKGSNKLYYGSSVGTAGTGNNVKIVSSKQKYIVINGNLLRGHAVYEDPPYNEFTYDVMRVWPEDFNSYNAKFKTKKDIADEEKVVADMVADAKKTCKVLGFKEESEKFADCTLKLYTQKVDELVAEKQAANTRMTQSQTGTTTQQSSGSNVTTIYDPVRDSKALMQQGQKMLSGRCTLGVDC